MRAIALFLLLAAPPAAEKTALLNELIQLAHVDAASFDVLAENLDERQLREAVTFFKSDAGKAFMKALTGGHADPSPEKRTMADMRSLATATEAYATDHNTYPDARNIGELSKLIAPTYIRFVPEKDGWGTPFVYLVSADHQTYRFVSAGPDKKFDKSSYDVGMVPAKSDDIIFENGEFVER